MTNIYIGYYFDIEPKEIASEILIAELGEKGFESFTETETGISAYIQKEFWNEKILENIYILESGEFKIKYTFEEIEQVNWNQEWEKNFSPIDIDGRCYIRAPFHTSVDCEYEIIIEPKMSFGTGHHETTYLMIQHLLEMDLQNLKTLDIGCGTAILAILAEKKGANPIDAIDIDNWCFLNSLENIEKNEGKHINIYEGDASLIKNKKYDLIIANINRNILINDMQYYASSLNPKGILLLSGFYEEDIPYIEGSCCENKLTFVKKLQKNNWVALKYIN